MPLFSMDSSLKEAARINPADKAKAFFEFCQFAQTNYNFPVDLSVQLIDYLFCEKDDEEVILRIMSSPTYKGWKNHLLMKFYGGKKFATSASSQKIVLEKKILGLSLDLELFDEARMNFLFSDVKNEFLKNIKERVKYLHPIIINGKSPRHEQSTLLGFAFENNKYESAKVLLAHGANPNAPFGTRDLTPLMFCARKNDKEGVHLLLKYKADINGVNQFKETPLMLYVKAADDDNNFLDFLIKRGARVNDRDQRGDTAFNQSLYFGKIKIAEKLMQHGARLDLLNNYGEGPVTFAAISKNSMALQFILAQQGVSQADKNRALLTAIQRGKKVAIDSLITEGADCRAIDVDGSTTLMKAAQKGNFQIIPKLMSGGADAYARNMSNETVFGVIRNGNYESMTKKRLFRVVKSSLEEEAIQPRKKQKLSHESID